MSESWSIMEPKMGLEKSISLFVKAGSDSKKYGACPFCQRIFMILLLKAESGHLKFRVITVPSSKYPRELKENGLRNLPAVIHGNEAIDIVEEIIDYIESKYPNPPLANIDEDSSIYKITRNFFSKFCFYIKAVSEDGSSLEADLSRLNEYLRHNSDFLFLSGDDLRDPDCEILPKLHHLRVAAKALTGFEISPNFVGIWRYLNNAYNSDIFTKSCPPDQEIILRWAERPDTKKSRLKDRDLSALIKHNQIPKFSFDVPAKAEPVHISR